MSRETERLEDEIAILQYRSGDREALSRLIARRQQPLYAYIRTVLGDTEAAWDVSQEVWAAVVKALRRPRKIRCFSAWLYRAAHNKCVSYLRRKGRAAELEDSAAEIAAGAPESIPDAISQVEDAGAVRDALNRLPLPQREVLTLYYLDDMPVRSIAEALGVPAGTVQSRLYHARLKMRSILSRKGYRHG